MRLDTRVALVTGGGSGIGRAIALRFAEEGARVVVNDIRKETAEATVKAIGSQARAIAADVADSGQVRAMFEEIERALGGLDVLVNNAGVGIGAAIDEYATKALDMQLDVNLRSYVIATREAVPMLKEAGAEHGKALVAITASIAGKYPAAWLSAYSATKAAVVALSIAAQAELMDDGIQVTAFCPAFVDTPMTEWVQGQVPPEEMIRPEDISEAVRFLLNTSSACLIPEVQFMRRGDRGLGSQP